MKKYRVTVKEWNWPIDNAYEVIVEAKGPINAYNKGNKKAREIFNIDNITETMVEEI